MDNSNQPRKPGGSDGVATAPPCAMVIFGASGDLTKRLIVPALYNLVTAKRLPEGFRLVGISRSTSTTEEWRESLYGMMKEFVIRGGCAFDHLDEAAWRWLGERMSYLAGDLNDPASYRRLGEHLAGLDKTGGTAGNRLFYLAVADRFFATVIEGLGAAGLVTEAKGQWRRVIIEKPFGHDLASAQALNAEILKVLRENQVYRIDHFLGKETVQNIMALRFANGLFEPIWNRDRIDHVQITAAETVGVEQRGDFYEKTGALRDMIPNHVFSLLSLVAMEPPTSFSAEAVRSKKAEVLAAIPPVDPKHAVRGQYGKGEVAGEKKKAYRDEPDVAKDSSVETYAALKLEIDNWRWTGVPFYVRSGKHLAARVTEIAIRFKQAPYSIFADTPIDALPPNWLVIRIAPDEGISLQFEVKRRGPVIDLAPVKMEFRYDDWCAKEPNVGYETLLYDVMIGDPTLFQRADIVEHGWRIVQPVLDAWEKKAKDFPNYASGSEGPKAADELIEKDGGRAWRPVRTPEKTA